MVTYQVSVQVEPHYLPEQSVPARSVHGFAYTVTVRNTGTATVQLIARHWIITNAHGHIEEVKGLGVVGQQPLLGPGEAFEYTSGCRLHTVSGTMHGSYFFVAEDGERFDVPIPPFVLDATDVHAGHAKLLH